MRISESSMSRIKHHVDEGKGFAIISGFTHGYYSDITKEILSGDGEGGRDMQGVAKKFEKENIDKHALLKKRVREEGYGYIELDGNYTYSGDISSDKNVSLKNVGVEEESLLIPFVEKEGSEEDIMGNFKDFIDRIAEIAEEFNQESIMAGFPKEIRDFAGYAIAGYYTNPSHPEYHSFQDWGSKFAVGEGQFGSSRLKKGTRGRKRISSETDFDASSAMKPKIVKEEDRVVVDFDNKGIFGAKRFKKGVAWHTENMSMSRQLKKLCRYLD